MERSPGQQLESRLEALLDDAFAGKNVHSAVAQVEHGDGSVRWAGARGEIAPGGSPITPETPWFTASITKLFIAAVVMRMVEEGELALEDRIVDRLPASLTSGLHVWKGADRTPQITLEHLLAHASGLPDYIEDYPAKDRNGKGDRRSLVEILVEEGDREWTLEDSARRIRTSLRPHFPPQPLGTRKVRIRYSDTNYQLLLGIVEAAREQSFADVLAELVLGPLELDRTWIPGRFRGEGPEPQVPTLYAGEEVVAFPRFFASIADLNATSDDLLTFAKALLGGERPGSGLFRDPGSWTRMQARWHRFAFPRDRAAIRQPSWPIEYGLGVMRFALPRPLTPFRRVPAVIGHTGSTGTWLFHAPELDLYLTGAVSQITAGPLPFRLVPKILRAVTRYT